ncbi:4-aminobutyrate transaminase [Deltaproteobacteria bacterium]|nr:4-aminobutyrate transaminase [Deltaproteobacteria bacterium]
MSKNQDLQQRRLAATPKGVGVMCSFYAEKAKNAEVWDVEGNRYIDFAGGIGVLNVGHLHPKVVAAIKGQLDKFSHTCFQIIPAENYIVAAERINKLAPGKTPKKTCFFSTGAEAVENAIKIARHYTGRPAVIAFKGSFHGRTNMTMGLTGKVSPYKIGFGPFPADIYHVPFPNAVHDVTVDDSLDAIKDLFKMTIDPKMVAAIILEPVQGEGGFNMAPVELIHALRKLCDDNGIVLIHDEVQCGFCRTGKLFATEYYDVEPDIITMAKSMSGGFPISAVCGKANIMDAPQQGGLGGTYAGSPLGLAAVNAVLDIIEEEKICERSLKLGEKAKARLKAIQKDVPQLCDVRGPGSMVALEFMKPGTKEPDPDFTKKVQALAMESGLLLLTCGTYYNNIRLLYPLTIEDKVFDEALNILEKAVRGAK